MNCAEFKKGRVFQFPFFGLLLAENKLSVSRFNFIVSNKISKRAVKRNKIKRFLRESVKTILPQVKFGFDIVFLVKKRIIGQDFQAVQSAVEDSFKKKGLL